VNWTRISIGRACRSIIVEDPRARRSFRYVDISSIDRSRKIIVEPAEIEGSAAPSRARKTIRAGDVLVSTVRPNLNAVAIVPKELDGQVASTGFSVLRPRKGELLARYLFYYCCTPGFVDALMAKVRGAHYPAVSDADVKEVEIPLPHPLEQRRIVEILDEADRLRRLRAEADAKAERILSALFLKLFGDPTTNLMRWEAAPLGEIGVLDRGRSRHRPRNDPALLQGPYPLIQTGDVAKCDGRIRGYTQTYSELGLTQSKIWPAGTLCITIAANIAKTGVLQFDACFPDSVVGFVPGPRVTTEYVQFLLDHLQPALELKAPQVAQRNINLEILRAVPTPIPPRPLQDAFTRYVSQHYDARARQIQVRESLDRLSASLSAQAFSGTLTASWRQAHMKEMLQEMEHQSEGPSGGPVT